MIRLLVRGGKSRRGVAVLVVWCSFSTRQLCTGKYVFVVSGVRNRGACQKHRRRLRMYQQLRSGLNFAWTMLVGISVSTSDCSFPQSESSHILIDQYLA